MSRKNAEESFETGMDEQAKQGAMQNLTEKIEGHDRRNDRSADYYETLRLERLVQMKKMDALENAEREQGLSERRNKAFNQDLVDKQAINHANHGYDRLVNLEPAEAKAISEVLSGVQIEAIKSAVAVAVAEALRAVK